MHAALCVYHGSSVRVWSHAARGYRMVIRADTRSERGCQRFIRVSDMFPWYALVRDEVLQGSGTCKLPRHTHPFDQAWQVVRMGEIPGSDTGSCARITRTEPEVALGLWLRQHDEEGKPRGRCLLAKRDVAGEWGDMEIKVCVCTSAPPRQHCLHARRGLHVHVWP
jgi:hypothetical protein